MFKSNQPLNLGNSPEQAITTINLMTNVVNGKIQRTVGVRVQRVLVDTSGALFPVGQPLNKILQEKAIAAASTGTDAVSKAINVVFSDVDGLATALGL